jgi:two-component sensor histidine kinase
VPLALVVNELLTNAVKHAFGGDRTGRVHVSLSAQDGTCRLCVADDGGGMAPGQEGSGIGRMLIGAFVAELGGELLTESGPEGTRITVEFPA